MCKCTPEVRAPFCGKPGCELPEQRAPLVDDPRIPTMLANARLSLESDRQMPREKLVEILHWCVEQLNLSDEMRSAHMRANVKLGTRSARLRALLNDAIKAMSDFHATFVPAGDPDLTPQTKPGALRAFVDAHARLMYELHHLPDTPPSPPKIDMFVWLGEISKGFSEEGDFAMQRAICDLIERSPSETGCQHLPTQAEWCPKCSAPKTTEAPR